MTVNLTLKGQEIAGLLSALQDPLVDFIMALAFVGGVVALLMAIVLVIIRSVGGVNINSLMKHK